MNYFLYYQIGSIKFATAIEEIKEIARAKDFIAQEKLPKNITGFFNLRGKRICIFDLPAFLEIEADKDFEIIVVAINQNNIGFKVEKIFGIVSAEQIIPYPNIVQTKDYLKGVIKQDKDILQILSFKRILSGQRLKAIQKYL